MVGLVFTLNCLTYVERQSPDPFGKQGGLADYTTCSVLFSQMFLGK